MSRMQNRVQCFPELTEPFARPPVRLFTDAEADVRVQPQAVVQVRRAALGLADDVEVWQASRAVQSAVPAKQVSPKRVPQKLKGSAEAFGVAFVLVPLVRVRGYIPSVFLVPTRILHARQELPRDDGKHLWRQTRPTVRPTHSCRVTFLGISRQ